MPLTQKGLLLAGIVDALSTLKEHKGSTSKSIINYIQANPLPDMKKRDITEVAIHKAIKQACENRILRHNGGRYCIDFEGMSCLANAARYSLGGRKAAPIFNVGLTDRVMVPRSFRTAGCRPQRCHGLRMNAAYRTCGTRRRKRCGRSCRNKRRRCVPRRRGRGSRRRRRRSCRRRRRSCKVRKKRCNRACRNKRRRCVRRRDGGPLEEPPKRRRRQEPEEKDSMGSLGSLPSLDMVDDMSDDDYSNNRTRSTRSGVLVNNMARSFLQKVIKK